MAFKNIYDLVRDYAYGQSGIKVNEKKQRVVVYSSTSPLLWITGLFCLGLGIVNLVYGNMIGLVVIALGLLFFGGLTQRTVFDMQKKEVRREVVFVATEAAEPQSIRFNTAVAKKHGKISSYVVGLEHDGKVMRGVAAFNDFDDLHRFQEVVVKMLQEMMA